MKVDQNHDLNAKIRTPARPDSTQRIQDKTISDSELSKLVKGAPSLRDRLQARGNLHPENQGRPIRRIFRHPNPHRQVRHTKSANPQMVLRSTGGSRNRDSAWRPLNPFRSASGIPPIGMPCMVGQIVSKEGKSIRSCDFDKVAGRCKF